MEGEETWIQTGGHRLEWDLQWSDFFVFVVNIMGFQLVPPRQCWIRGVVCRILLTRELQCACAKIHILSIQPVDCVFYKTFIFNSHTNFQWRKTHDFASYIISPFLPLISSLNHKNRRNNYLYATVLVTKKIRLIKYFKFIIWLDNDPDIGSQIRKRWHIFIYASIIVCSGFEDHCRVGG